MFQTLANKLIAWLVRRTPRYTKYALTSWDATGTAKEKRQSRAATRLEPFLPDEVLRGNLTIYRPLPWWAPFNILLHHWWESDDGPHMHDHPRWNVSIVLRGQLTELTPWGERTLTPGSIVIRSPKAIHGFRVEKQHSGKTWTLFIVGRRRYQQSTYQVKKRSEEPKR